MKADIKGFIRNVVANVLNELVARERLFDKHGIAMEDYEEDFQEIKDIAEVIVESHLDCIIEDDNKIIKECMELLKQDGKNTKSEVFDKLKELL